MKVDILLVASVPYIFHLFLGQNGPKTITVDNNDDRSSAIEAQQFTEIDVNIETTPSTRAQAHTRHIIDDNRQPNVSNDTNDSGENS